VIYAEALDAAGDRDAARATLRAAHAEVLARADRIEDPAVRAAFLACVPENARVIALARSWLGENAPTR
jgi:hypothetical protein